MNDMRFWNLSWNIENLNQSRSAFTQPLSFLYECVLCSFCMTRHCNSAQEAAETQRAWGIPFLFSAQWFWVFVSGASAIFLLVFSIVPYLLYHCTPVFCDCAVVCKEMVVWGHSWLIGNRCLPLIGSVGKMSNFFSRAIIGWHESTFQRI